jgi:hypothetical protein
VLGQIVMIGGAVNAELDPTARVCLGVDESAQESGAPAVEAGGYPEGASATGSTAAASASRASTASRGRPEGTA